MKHCFLFHPIRCLTDARQTGSKSHFLQQTQDDKLQFQLEAFRFHQDERSSVSNDAFTWRPFYFLVCMYCTHLSCSLGTKWKKQTGNTWTFPIRNTDFDFLLFTLMNTTLYKSYLSYLPINVHHMSSESKVGLCFQWLRTRGLLVVYYRGKPVCLWGSGLYCTKL
jgi:hypothetical protein